MQNNSLFNNNHTTTSSIVEAQTLFAIQITLLAGFSGIVFLCVCYILCCIHPKGGHVCFPDKNDKNRLLSMRI